jgi:hypothetical protein
MKVEEKLFDTYDLTYAFELLKWYKKKVVHLALFSLIFLFIIFGSVDGIGLKL